MFHHLQIAVHPLLHLFFHFVAWLPDLMVSTNFKLLLDLCLLLFYHSSLDLFFCHKFKSLQQLFAYI
jgi:hypothetical protein